MKFAYGSHLIGLAKELIVSSLLTALLLWFVPEFSQGITFDVLFVFTLVRVSIATISIMDALLNQVHLFGPKRIFENMAFYRGLRAHTNAVFSGLPALQFRSATFLYLFFIIASCAFAAINYGNGSFRWILALCLFLTMVLSGRSVMHNSTPMVLFLGNSGEETTFGLMLAKRILRTRHFASMLSFEDQGAKGFWGHGTFGSIRVREENWKSVFHRVVEDARLVIVHRAESSSDELDFEINEIEGTEKLRRKTIFFNANDLKGRRRNEFKWREFVNDEENEISRIRDYFTQSQ